MTVSENQVMGIRGGSQIKLIGRSFDQGQDLGTELELPGLAQGPAASPSSQLTPPSHTHTQLKL